MRPVRQVLLLAALGVLCCSPAAAAGGPPGRDGTVRVVPAHRVAGETGGQLLGDWFVQNLSLPAPASPFAGSADLCLDLGRRGKVLSPSGGLLTPEGMTCTVKANRPVLLVMSSADCSTAEPRPFFGRTAAEQRRCAIDALTNSPDFEIQAINVSLDGAPAVDIASRAVLRRLSAAAGCLPGEPGLRRDARPGDVRRRGMDRGDQGDGSRAPCHARAGPDLGRAVPALHRDVRRHRRSRLSRDRSARSR